MKKPSLTTWIFLGMAAGVLIGALWPDFGKQLQPASNMFLRLIKSIIAPLLFATLVYGIAGTGSVKTMGRIGLKAIIYFEIVTTIALFLGLGMVNWLKPGVGVHVAGDAAAPPLPAAKQSLSDILEHTVPASIIDAMAKGEVLQIVVFAFLFGSACAVIGAKARPIVEFTHSLSEVMFKYTSFVMYFAPIGVAAAIAVPVATKGLGVLMVLGKVVAVALAAQFVFVVFVLGAVVLLARIPLRRFIAAVREPFLIAFSTASSEAALPKALLNMERFGVPNHIVAFVLPTGYSFNLDGSTLHLALSSVFCAQVAGIDLTLGQQLIMMLTLMLTSKGVAGVPRASFVILSGTLATFNIPMEGIGLLLGVDVILDMVRTSVNVLGNCLATAVVARWEGVKLEVAPPEPLAVES
ncbi:MAG: cation:dicarboxylase symporter family transporter [Bryobacteraceae bacterium]|nr:cation:dicarboxylase symporter family transporter [Bryobacteraceae bacterium]